MMRKIALVVCILWMMPLIVGQVFSSVDSGSKAVAAEKKKKTRKVPAMREVTYKRLAEAQVMIDPESAPREEGEPAPEPKGTPQDAIQILLKLKDRRGLNSYELAQVWNTLAFAYYTVEDVPNTLKIPVGTVHKLPGARRLTSYDAGTNGLVYQQTVAEMPNLSPQSDGRKIHE